MVDGLENPYRGDVEADTLFVGREGLIEELAATILGRRNAIHAVMGGRGMGKSSFAKRLQKRLGSAAHTIVTSGRLFKVRAEIDLALNVDLADPAPIEALAEAPSRHPSGRVALVIDEVEQLINDPDGRAFLDNLREAYDKARGSLAVVVLGGTGVRDLLFAEWSPFLRVAGPIHTLAGLERSETASLVRDPLGLAVSDDVVDALWAETAGHPWLLQMFMESAVQLAARLDEVAGLLPAAIQKTERRLHSVAFPMWWDNLRARGQEIYRLVARQPSSVPRAEWVRRFGNDPRPWLEVLASTGLASLDDGAVIARGTLFQRWVEDTHPAVKPAAPSNDDALGTWLTAVGVDAFERLVVRALAAWARATVEFPAAAVRLEPDRKADNSSLQREAFFQMHALVALLQHEEEIIAEPEALSMKPQGRSDIKVRSLHEPTRRACVEVKIFGRNDTEVVSQVLGYAAPPDTFAAVVSVDRSKRPLRPAYEERCFEGAPIASLHDAPAGVSQPVFYTVHARQGHGPVRVWHFLVQLGDSAPAS